jgi:predicted acyl esterase
VNSVRTIVFVVATILLFAPRPGAAQQIAHDYTAAFDKVEVMIPMRDGVMLHTEIYSPKNATERLPILFERTPYGISGANGGYSPMLVR